MTQADLPPIYVLRHGETEWNRSDRMQGWGDSPLTELGRAQAQAQGRILRKALPERVDIRVSPSGRAMETARIALGNQALRAVEDPRLREVNVGDWVGRTPQDLACVHGFIRPDVDRHLWKFRAPGGETLDEMAERCRAVLRDLRGPSVLVTHGVTSRLLRCLALGLLPETLGDLPGGQGVVHVIEAGKARILRH